MADESGFEVIPTQASSQIDHVEFNAATGQGAIVFWRRAVEGRRGTNTTTARPTKRLRSQAVPSVDRWV